MCLLISGCFGGEKTNGNDVSSPFPINGIDVSFSFWTELACGTPPPRGEKPLVEKIAVTVDLYDSSSNEEVALINSDGLSLTVLTNHLAADGMAEWRSDGKKIAFVSTHGQEGDPEIWVMNSDGTDQTQLTFNTVSDMNPRWSPDGTKILYTSRLSLKNQISEIFVMNMDGSSQKQITFHSKGLQEKSEVRFPCWSPDGSKILYSYNKGVANRERWLQEIWTIQPDGSGPRRIVEEGYYGFWFPDGNRIVFEGPTDKNDSTPLSYLVNADGSGQTPVSTAFPKSVQIGLMGISTDGTRILVKDISSDSMYVVYLDNGNMIKISDTYLQRPVWSPDGTKILGERHDHSEGENFEMQVWEINADGSGEKQLTHFQTEKGKAYGPRWAPY